MAPRQLAPPIRFVPGLVLAVALTTSATTAAGAQVRSVTLDDALRRAELVDPQVTQAQGAVRNAGAQVRAAYGNFLPSFGTSANFSNSFSGGESRLDPITNEIINGSISSTGVNFGADASYDLFTGFRRGKDISSARAQRASAEATLDYERAQNRLRTTRTFVDAIQSASLVQVQRESIRRAEEQFRIAVAKLATRRLPPVLQRGAEPSGLPDLGPDALAGISGRRGRDAGRDGRGRRGVSHSRPATTGPVRRPPARYRSRTGVRSLAFSFSGRIESQLAHGRLRTWSGPAKIEWSLG